MKKSCFVLSMIIVLFYAVSMVATPSGIQGLRVWLDAEAITGLNNNDPIQTWNDESGNNYNAVQNTLANRPLYIEDGINGRPVVRFDGVNDWLQITPDSGLNMTTFSLIVVFKAQVPNQSIQVITAKESAGASPWNNRNWWFSINNNDTTQGIPSHTLWLRTSIDGVGPPAGGLELFSAANAYDDDNPYIAILTVVGSAIGDGTAYLYTQGVERDSDLSVGLPDVASQTMYIGRQAGATLRCFKGDLAELIIYDEALSPEDSDVLYDYLYNKYFTEQPLPVVLSSFTATIIANNYVQLRWLTESETNFLGYNVLRNTESDLGSAYRINPLIISGTGTNSGPQTYTFIDEDVEMDVLYYYWLESIDLDITIRYHGPVSVKTGQVEEPGTPPQIEYTTKLIGAYPNPFNPGTSIRFELDQPATISITIFNILGQHIRTISQSFEAGENTIYWDGNDTKGNPSLSGIYFYRFNASFGYQQYDKMILLK